MKKKKPSLKYMFVPDKSHYDAFIWCNKRYIRVYPKIQKDSTYKLVREDDGQVVFVSKETFGKDILDEKIWRFYKYIFDSKKK